MREEDFSSSLKIQVIIIYQLIHFLSPTSFIENIFPLNQYISEIISRFRNFAPSYMYFPYKIITLLIIKREIYPSCFYVQNRNATRNLQTNRRISPLRAWLCAHASSSLTKFQHLEVAGFHEPIIFQAETPLRKFVAYIDPEDKFAIEDKLSQVSDREKQMFTREDNFHLYINFVILNLSCCRSIRYNNFKISRRTDS